MRYVKPLPSNGTFWRVTGRHSQRRVVAETEIKDRAGKVRRTVTYSIGSDRNFTILRSSFMRWKAKASWFSPTQAVDTNDQNFERLSYGERPGA